MASEKGINAALVHPTYLHSIGTAHTWIFSAIAELIDNACDTDVNARDLWIDKETIGDQTCLTFVDNGSGMNHDKLFKMLSFGFNEKEDIGKQLAIGRYGIGFKSGSMRIGSDAIVITRDVRSTSVGLLSQSYLSAIHVESIIIPIVSWDRTPNGLTRKRTLENVEGLKAILQHSIFTTETSLTEALDEKLGKTKLGTKIIIYNLNKDSSGNFELDFVSDEHDIRNPENAMMDQKANVMERKAYVISPEHRRSLMVYCSILYLKPRMKIILRGKKVPTKWIEKTLFRIEKDVYNPSWAGTRLGVTLKFGFTNDKTANAPYGLMMYHKNRLIVAYKKIGCQKTPDKGVGVIGVVEANFLQVIHNKQKFNEDTKYTAFINNAATKLNDYYNEKTFGVSSATADDDVKPPWNWVQCDNCRSFRRLPRAYNEELPEQWNCKDNPDPQYNRCEIPEETVEKDEEEVQAKPTYEKTVKKKKVKQKRQAKLEEERKAKETEEALKAAKEEGERLKIETQEALRKEAEAKEALKKEVEKKKPMEVQDYKMEMTSEETAKDYELGSQGNAQEALEHNNEAIKRNPNNVELYHNRAVYYAKLNEFSKALEDTDQCLRIDPEFIKGYLCRGNIYKTLKNSTKAVEAFGTAVELDPNCQAARQGLQLSHEGNQSGIGREFPEEPPLDVKQDQSLQTSRKRKYPGRDNSDERVSRSRALVTKTLPVGGNTIAMTSPRGVRTIAMTPPLGVSTIEVTPPLGVGTIAMTPPLGVGTIEVTPPLGVGTIEVKPPLGVDTIAMTPPLGVGTIEVTPPLGVGTSEVKPPLGVGTIEVTLPLGVSTIEVTLPRGVSTIEVTPPLGVDTIEVKPPLGVGTIEVTPPLGVGTIEVTPPLGVDTIEVKPPLGVGTIEVTPPLGVDTIEMKPPLGVGTIEVTPPLGVGTIEVKPPLGVGTIEVTLPLGVGTIEVTPPLGVSTIEVTPPLGVDTIEVKPPLGVDTIAKTNPVCGGDKTPLPRGFNVSQGPCTTLGTSASSETHTNPSPSGILGNDGTYSTSVRSGTTATNSTPGISVAFSACGVNSPHNEFVPCRTSLDFTSVNSNMKDAANAKLKLDTSDRTSDKNEMEDNCKPDEQDLKQMITEMDMFLSETTSEVSETKLLQHKGTQTMEYGPTNQRQALLRTRHELNDLRTDILSLLKILLPGSDLGDQQNIGKVVKGFLKDDDEQKNGS